MVSSLVIRDGVINSYDRLAVQEQDGSLKLVQLQNDEVRLCPGLIYRRVSSKPRVQDER
jgi:hypothetical protein